MGAVVLIAIVFLYVGVGIFWLWYGTHELPAWWLRRRTRSDGPGSPQWEADCKEFGCHEEGAK